ncbi:hypothetical protein [Streptomyces flavofungini]|uniref:hypothetical protein n=1 Tax=Streptomyces flavofungini TaxID=68200 RepID=UPI0025B2660F|nr:hypothetical protein [Streptomyces flavofungini]WJV46501.1 hypothetical protein QUY26_13760 [Streptomyces flavofungini]
MSQSWQPQPPQYGQQPQYGQPPQQPGYGYPGPGQNMGPYPPQQPMPHGYPYAPGFPPPGGAQPGRAFFLGLIVSAGLSLAYAGILFASHEDLSRVGLQASYLACAAVLAVVVGVVTGRTGGRDAGPAVWAAVLAALGAYLGVANGYVFTLLDIGGTDLLETVLDNEPMAPHKFWWKRVDAGFALAGLAVAMVGAYAVNRAVSKKQPH